MEKCLPTKLLHSIELATGAGMGHHRISRGFIETSQIVKGRAPSMRSRRYQNSVSPKRGTGYCGQMTLRSPSGEIVTVEVPGRTKWSGKVEPRYGELPCRQDRKFQRLLSAGYTVVSDKRSPEGEEPEAGEEEKKFTSSVVGATQ